MEYNTFDAHNIPIRLSLLNTSDIKQNKKGKYYNKTVSKIVLYFKIAI